MMSHRGPDFLYIGPDKSGSSWLFKVLESHPECYVPPAKDLYYFDKYFENGLEWYLKFFEKTSPGKKVLGEISHGYLFDESAPQRIYDGFPHMKILTTLRNPVERSISHYFYLKSGGLINVDIQSAITERPGIINSSLYYEAVKRYLDIFPRDQLFISYFEDLKDAPRDYAFRIFDFLGLSQLDCMDFSKKVREARKPNSMFLAKVMKQASLRARDLGLANLVGKVKNSELMNKKLYRPLEKADKENISDGDKVWLLNQFVEDIDRLQDLMDIDLAHWKVLT
jgi:hypothetical protein